MPKASRLTIALTALALAAASQGTPLKTAPRAAIPGSARDLCDRPTACRSLPDRLEMEYEWRANDRGTKRFLVVVPPERSLDPTILEIEVERIDSAPTTGPIEALAHPVGWLNGERAARDRIFGHEPVGYIRHFRIEEVRVTPLFRAGIATVRIKRVRWAYRWKKRYAPENAFRDRAIARTDQGFGDILPRLIVNPDGLAIYGDPNPPKGQFPNPSPRKTFDRLAGGKRPILRLGVDKRALYRLDLGTVVSAEGGAKPRLENLQLYNKGKPVPLYLHRNPNRPDRAAELIFYGVPSYSKYTRTNRYWLVENPSLKPVRMAEVPVSDAWRSLPPEKSFPESLTIEQDNELIIHADNFLTISEFDWVWGEIPPADRPASVTAILAHSPPDKHWFTSATFSLPGMAEPKGRTKFDISFYYSATRLAGPVGIEVRINNGPAQVFTLKEPDDLKQSFVLPNSLLRETSNTIRVRFLPGRLPRGESVYFDKIVAHYRRRFEVPHHGFTFRSDPPTTRGWRHYALTGNLPPRPLVLDVADAAHPKVIRYERDAKGGLHFGQKELVPAVYRILSLDEISTPVTEPTTGLADVAEQKTPIDYLIISHHDFIDLLDPLVASLRKAGWRVRVVDVENVYASFSWGLSGPVAIKAFLDYALRHWPGGGPTYVLFVGDCTSDYRGDFRNNVKNFVPSYTLERGRRIEKWASEHWFTTLCGTDEYSDVILGRLSVNNRKDAATVIRKIVRYRDHPLLDPWRMTLTYIADQGAFDSDAERLRERFKPPAFVGQRLYLEEFPWEDNFYLPPEIVEADKAKVSPVMTTRILEMFNRGAAFVSYRGHGSPNIWSNERIWFGGDSPNSDIRLLRNGDHLPFIANLTCNSGAIDYPDPPWNLCISEDFMRCPTGGAIAMFVPTGPGVPTSHMRLSEEFHRVVFEENVRAFGDIVFLTKYRYLLKRFPLEMIKMFLFLGEPSCRIQLPDEQFRMAVDRPVVSALTGGRVAVSGRTDLPEGRKGLIALYTPKDELVTTAPLEFSRDGRFEHAFVLKPTDEAGTWTVRAYCWNDKAGRDAVGWAEIVVARPKVVLARVDINTSSTPILEGEPTTFTCIVANRSALPARGVLAKLYRLARDRRFLIEETKIDLAPFGERTVRLPWKARAGFFQFKVAIGGAPETIGHPSPAEREKTVEVAVVKPKTGCRVVFAPRAVTTKLSRAGRGYMRQTSVAVGNIGDQPAMLVSLSLADDDSSETETQKVGRLAPGETRSVGFTRTIPSPVLPREYRISLEYRDATTSKPAVAKLAEKIGPGELPDLVILGDRIRFVDEANLLIFGDPRPTDGHTVYIDVPVKNIGGAPADQPFVVEAYDGDPAQGGRRLRCSTELPGRKKLAFLDPGQVETVRFRWDPFHNAGPRRIYFVVDGDQRITESNEKNNETSRDLRVLTKGKLATGKIRVRLPTFDEARAGIRPLLATVINEGETTVTKVLVEYYLGPKLTPPNKIGQVLVAQIGPKSKVEAELKWKPTREQAQRAVREKFSFLVRLKGSTRRVTSLPE